MVRVTNTQKFVLFTLGRWYDEANKKLDNKLLKLAISKVVFIDIIMKSGLAEKKERALYKNFESLEKKKLISYSQRNLSLTEKGLVIYKKIQKELNDYLGVIAIIETENPLNYTKKAQSVFRK